LHQGAITISGGFELFLLLPDARIAPVRVVYQDYLKSYFYS
jgi:hypothetical protein